MTLRIIFLLALILTASCKEESSVKQEQETTSKQTNEKFIWDFTNPKKYSYTFKQTAETISKLAQNDTPSFSKSEINGLINVVVKKENTADFSLTDATTTFTTFNNDGKIKDTISQALPPSVIENIQPNYRLFLNEKCTIGTDSLASNWSLSVLDELKTIQKKNSTIALEKLLKWATLNGAMFLGFDDELGSIIVGKRPGLNLITHIKSNQLTNKSEVVKIDV